MLYPFTFKPIFKQRVWGGRNLERLYGKPIPPNEPIGESWEITDRPEGVSVIANGPLAGKDLRWLMEEHGEALLGTKPEPGQRFPLLIKILDAQDTLSVQVHPPAEIAGQLGGEPKTEMWFIADATPEAALYAGLKAGVDRAAFEKSITNGTAAECLHRLPVKTGDAMFLPSGRVHAIGAGNVIFEIQQNSDTTYRVFDWNRVGLDGKPRELHIEQSLASINFDDHEPTLITSIYSRNESFPVHYLVDNPLFNVDACQVKRGQRFHLRSGLVQVLAVVQGRLSVSFQDSIPAVVLQPGDFCLLPAALGRVTLVTELRTEYLHIQA